VEYVLQKPLS